MPENQKQKMDRTMVEDQKERGYYYDDAHGYEEYVPEEDDECVESTDDADESGPQE